jgi:hypothetical protein
MKLTYTLKYFSLEMLSNIQAKTCAMITESYVNELSNAKHRYTSSFYKKTLSRKN